MGLRLLGAECSRRGLASVDMRSGLDIGLGSVRSASIRTAACGRPPAGRGGTRGRRACPACPPRWGTRRCAAPRGGRAGRRCRERRHLCQALDLDVAVTPPGRARCGRPRPFTEVRGGVAALALPYGLHPRVSLLGLGGGLGKLWRRRSRAHARVARPASIRPYILPRTLPLHR
jgi:hypothetical protein